MIGVGGPTRKFNQKFTGGKRIDGSSAGEGDMSAPGALRVRHPFIDTGDSNGKVFEECQRMALKIACLAGH